MVCERFTEKLESRRFDPVYLLMVFALVMRMITFMGMAQGDDFTYSVIANRFANGDFAAKTIFFIRWVVFVPVALLYRMFGVNDYTSTLPTMVYGVLTIWLAYKVVEEETDRLTAVVAVLFYSTFPLVLTYANFLQVAAPLDFFTLLTVYSFQKGAKTEQLRWFVIGGLSIGCIFFTRTTGLFIAPLVSFWLWYKKGFNKRSVLWVVAAALCSLILPALQGLVYLKVHNDFFYYVTISRQGVEYQNKMTDVDPKDLFFYIRTVFTTGNFANWRRFGFGGYFTVAAIIACIVKWCLKKPGKELIFFIWFVSYFLFMSFAPTSFSPYTTLIRNNRYAIIFVLPLCAVCAVLLSDFIKTGKKAAVITAGLIFLTVFASNICFSIGESGYFKKVRDERKQSMALLLAHYPDTRIYIADRNLDYHIDYYSGYTNRNYRYISSLKQIKEPGVFLILNNLNFSASRLKIPKEELKKLRKNPPKGMTLKHKTPYFNIYEVDPAVLKTNPDLR